MYSQTLLPSPKHVYVLKDLRVNLAGACTRVMVATRRSVWIARETSMRIDIHVICHTSVLSMLPNHPSLGARTTRVSTARLRRAFEIAFERGAGVATGKTTEIRRWAARRRLTDNRRRRGSRRAASRDSIGCGSDALSLRVLRAVLRPRESEARRIVTARDDSSMPIISIICIRFGSIIKILKNS